MLATASIAVPNVVGQSQAAAQATLTGQGFTVTTSNASNASSATVATGNVISQTPASGTSVVSGSSVNLLISSGVSAPPTASNPIQSIPTLSTWGLISLSALIPLLAARASRKKYQA